MQGVVDVVQFGGQTPLKLAQALKDEGIPILGTTPDAIDLAEDRERFQRLLSDLGLKQPVNGIARSPDEARAIASEVGFPLVIRPSYVLGGRAMEICYSHEDLATYLDQHVKASPEHPLLLDRFLEDAIEVDVDALCDGTECRLAGIMQGIKKRVIDGTASSAHAKAMSERVGPLVERAHEFAVSTGMSA